MNIYCVKFKMNAMYLRKKTNQIFMYIKVILKHISNEIFFSNITK